MHTTFESLEPRRLMAADLAGTAFDVPGGQPINAGNFNQATVTIKNLNIVWFLDDAGPFNVRVFVSDNSTISTNDIEIGSIRINSLGAGQTITQTIPCSPPAQDPFRTDNQYWVGVVIDADGEVSESNESNNSNRGDGLDREQVRSERHLWSPPYGNGQLLGADPIQLGQSVQGAIGGSEEWMGAYDIDTYRFSAPGGTTVAFDLDSIGGMLDSYLRIYTDNGNYVDAFNDNGSAPGEPAGNLDSFLTYTLPFANNQYWVVVSSSGNHTSDPSIMTGRSAGSTGSYVLNTYVVPAPPVALDMTSGSDSGLSQTDNLTNDMTPSFAFYGQPGMIGQLLVNGNVVASDENGTPDGLYEVTAPALADGTYTVTARIFDPSIGYYGNASTPLSITIDTAGPTLVEPIAFQFETAPQKLTMRFSDDVVQTIGSNDLTVVNLDTHDVIGSTLAYDQAARRATFTLSAPAPGVLPQGLYRATLSTAGVTDAAGNGIAGGNVLVFDFLPADANRDQNVDTIDFNILAANFSKSGKTFSQGNFDYDAAGSVDTIDFNLLAANFGRTLSAPSASQSASPPTATTSAALIASPFSDARLTDEIFA